MLVIKPPTERRYQSREQLITASVETHGKRAFQVGFNTADLNANYKLFANVMCPTYAKFSYVWHALTDDPRDKIEAEACKSRFDSGIAWSGYQRWARYLNVGLGIKPHTNRPLFSPANDFIKNLNDWTCLQPNN